MGDIECCVLKQERNIVVDDIQCCALKQERSKAWVIYIVVYGNRREINRGLYKVLCTKRGVR